jgi:hypothetical protein
MLATWLSYRKVFMCKESKFIKLLSTPDAKTKGGTNIYRDVFNSSIEGSIAEGDGATQIFEGIRGSSVKNSYSGPDASRHNLILLMREVASSGQVNSNELLTILSNILEGSNPAEQKSSYKKLLEFVALHNDAFGPVVNMAVAFASFIIAKIS